MYIKIFAHGKGDASSAASYVMDDVDHLNIVRADVQVLRGDPQTFTAIAESIQNEWKYTSGVIAWSKDDAPTNDEINEVLDTFENHAFAGLQPNQYHFTAVLHQEDDGSKHVHFLVPRIELDTGKALNIAPPGHANYFDPLRDYFNYKKGWSRPDDETLKRDTQTPDHDHFQNISAIKAGLVGKKADDIREVVGEYLEQRIKFGHIQNRQSVLDALSEIGEITRINDKFISLKLDGAKKAVRLKGAFYESEFSVESYIENRTRKENDAGASNTSRFISEQDKEYAEELRARVTELAQKRAAYNEHRYGIGSTSSREHDFSAVREQELSSMLTSSSPSNKRPLFTADATATTAQSTVSAVEQYQSRHIQDSKAQESPFYIKCDFSFDSSYFYYQQYRSRIRQQKQVQRDASERSTFTANRSNDTTENSRVQHGDNSTVQSTSGQINDTGSAIIENYRRSTVSVEATTASTRRSSTAYTSTVSDHQRIEAIHANFKQQAQRSSEDSAEISANSARTIRANYLSNFFTRCTGELENTVADTFKRFSAELADREPGPQSDQTRNTAFSASRDRAAIEADDRANNQENEFSRAISTKISGVNPDCIFKALDELDKRNELKREQERSSKYDGPSF